MRTKKHHREKQQPKGGGGEVGMHYRKIPPPQKKPTGIRAAQPREQTFARSIHGALAKLSGSIWYRPAAAHLSSSRPVSEGPPALAFRLGGMQS